MRPDARAFLDQFNATPLAHMETMEMGAVRAMLKLVRDASGAVPEEIAVKRDLSFSYGDVELPVRLYDVRERREAGPITVYYHGGGFVLGDLQSHDAICTSIAKGADLPVVAVDYRLAPEHPWPAAPEDAEAAARWVAEHATVALGREATSLVMAGDSAGANLAAITAGALRDRAATVPVAAQYLIYPCTAATRDTPSRRDYAEGLFLTAAAIDWFFMHYGAIKGDRRIDLHADSLEGMPPTLIVTVGLDPLLDEGREYAASLIRSGVPVIYQEAIGNIHGSFSMAAAIPSTKADIDHSLQGLKILLRK